MLRAGDHVGPYRIEAEIARGGMATVYRARHRTLGGIQALKVLHVGSSELRERLLAEGRAQAQLRSPYVVRVHDVLDGDSGPVLAMEYVDGPSLETWLIEKGAPDLERAVQWATEIASALDAAHVTGRVHRDLKPGNVLIDRALDLRAKVSDFGLVKATATDRDVGPRTLHGATMGTPEFMAPEQVRDASTVDPRADLYSLGVVLYALVSGRLPYRGTPIEIARMAASGTVTPLSRWVPEVPAALEALCHQLMSPRPEDRPQTAAEVVRRLQAPSCSLPRGPTRLRPERILELARNPDAGPWHAPAPRPTPLWPGLAPLAAAGLSAWLVGQPPAAPVEVPPSPPPAVATPTPPSPRPEPAVPPTPAPSQPPAPAPAPPAAAPRRAAPARPPLTPVAVRGDATRVWLVTEGDRFAVPGPVPPGEYQVVALFPGMEPLEAGRVTVADGAPLDLTCAAFARRCR